jgi:hypothetical protein
MNGVYLATESLFPPDSLFFSLLAGNLRWRLVRNGLHPQPPSPTVPVVSWRRANSAELAGFARWKLVSGPVLDGETPFCAALSLLGKFRFPAGF